jgi:predicted NBD/HSP70 family sugar kinase
VLSDNLAELVAGLMSAVPKRRRALLVFMGICVAASWAIGVRQSKSSVSLVTGASFAALALAAGAWFLVDTFRDRSRASTQRLPVTSGFLTIRPIGGQHVIGISIERGRVVYGALELAGNNLEPLGRIRVSGVCNPQSRTWTRPGEAYDAVARGIIEILDKVGDRKIDGIGIGMPGLVDITRGELQGSPANLRPGHIPGEIASALGKADRAAAHRLGLDVNINALAKSVGRYIAVDNDARCIGRFLLNAHPVPGSFLGMYVGKGIGSAIVLNGELYFGSHGFAGECGHQVLNLGRRVTLQGKDGWQRDIETPQCKCERRGFHYETLINDSGLLRLADAIDGEFFADLQDHLAQTGGFEGAALLQCAEEVLSFEDSTALGEACKIAAKGDYKRAINFFERLEDVYVQLLTMGIANAVNMLDLDDVYLTGPIVESFDRLPRFRGNLKHSLKRYLFRDDRVSLHIEVAAAQHVWIGAGLVFRDSGYAAALRLPQDPVGDPTEDVVSVK